MAKHAIDKSITLRPTTQHDVNTLKDLVAGLRAESPINEAHLFGLLRAELELVAAQYSEDEQGSEMWGELMCDDDGPYIEHPVDLTPLRRAFDYLEAYEQRRRAAIRVAEDTTDNLVNKWREKD